MMKLKIPDYEEFVKYALKMKNITSDTFEETNLRVFVRDTANSGTMFTVLRKDSIVILVLNVMLLD